MSKRHNLSLQELFRLGYQQRTWQSFLLKGSKCFISSCVLRYANSYYTGHCLFRGVRRNFTAIICFASLAFAHLVQEEKNWGQTDSKQGSEKKKRHYIAETVDLQFRTCLLITAYKTVIILEQYTVIAKLSLALSETRTTHLDCSLPFQVMPCLLVSFVAFRL